ncbi:MAG: sulfatase-like hydrolase/transferase [Deltaproteobacteria bacterium]|nr:sulfatase-like hydrolase/transferase [Deltaproteobacteria bacterium]
MRARALAAGTGAALFLSAGELAVSFAIAPSGYWFVDPGSAILSIGAAAVIASVLAHFSPTRTAAGDAPFALALLLIGQTAFWGSRTAVAYGLQASHANPLSAAVMGASGLAALAFYFLMKEASARRVAIVGAASALYAVALASAIQIFHDDDAVYRFHARARVAPPPSVRSPSGASNLLLVVVDTLRADALGCYGAKGAPSPAIDELATRGTLFEDVSSVSSWTRPAVGTMMTGLIPREHRMTALTGRMPDPATTLAQKFAAAGYRTGAVVMNPILKSYFGFARGFRDYEEQTNTVEASFWMTGRSIRRLLGGSGEKRTRKADDASLAVDKMLGWIDRGDGAPFFGYLHLMDPHAPYDPPEPFRSKHLTGAATRFSFLYNGGDLAATADPKTLDAYRALYDAEVEFTDRELGRLFAELEKRGIRGKTRIVLMADHGEQFREHGGLLHGYSLYQEEIRVPLIVAGLNVPAGRRVSIPRSLASIHDAILSLMGLAGGDAWTRFTGDDPEPDIHAEVDAVLHGRDVALFAARNGGRKLIWDFNAGTREVYDLTADPGERKNLADADAEGFAAVENWREESERAHPRPPRPDGRETIDPAEKAALRSLGYIQ